MHSAVSCIVGLLPIAICSARGVPSAVVVRGVVFFGAMTGRALDVPVAQLVRLRSVVVHRWMGRTNSVNCMDWTESGTPLALKCSKLVREASEYFIQPIEEHFP